MAISKPALKDLIDRILGDIKATVSPSTPILDKSVLSVLADVEGGTAYALYGFAQFIADQIFADSAEGLYLDRIASLWGISRKPAAFATGAVQFSGVNGTIIPALTLLAGSNGIEYETQADATVAGGVATVTVEALTSGSTGNLTAGTILPLGAPIAGVNSDGTVQAPGITGGSDTESDDDLRSRILARVQDPPSGGNAADFVRWATEVPGITRAWCIENYLGAGTVAVVCVADDSDPITPPQAKLDEVAAYIEVLRPVCSVVYVLAPTLVPINFTLSVVPDSAANRLAVEESLKSFIADKSTPGATIYLSQIREAISSTAGITDFTMTVPAGNVILVNGQLATMGAITWV